MRTILLSLLCVSACATVTAESDQRLHIGTSPEQGLPCSVTDQQGVHSLDTTPGEITVKRAYHPLLIRCGKEDGGAYGEATIEASTRGRAYGNILLGGVPAFIDAGTGKGYEYPANITIPVSPEGMHTTIKP